MRGEPFEKGSPHIPLQKSLYSGKGLSSPLNYSFGIAK